MACPFNDIDAEAIGLQVTQFLKVAVRSERNLPGNMVAPKLKATVEEFKQLLPAVVDLRNRALKPRHWAVIETIISHRMDPVRLCVPVCCILPVCSHVYVCVVRECVQYC
jgi:hypothetical protein